MSLLNYPKFKAFSTSGIPLAGGLLNTYEAGTVNTPQVAYSDILCTVPLSNPIVLDNNGEAAIYLKGSYKLVLTDSNSVPLWTLDNVSGIGASSLVSIESYGGSLETAIVSIGSTPSQILIDTTITQAQANIIPSTLALNIVKGGSIALNGHNLTINGPFTCARFTAFSGTGTVTFGSGVLQKPADPTWWGGGAGGVTAANAAINILGTLTVNSATPDISAAVPVFITANTTGTVITNFANLLKGLAFDIIVNDAHTSFAFGTNILGYNGTTWYPQVGDTIHCVTDGTKTYCSKMDGTPFSYSALQVINDVTYPNTKIGITAKQISLSNGAAKAFRVMPVSVSIDFTTNGLNGLDTGSLANTSWYALYVISNGSTVAGFASLLPDPTYMPAGYVGNLPVFPAGYVYYQMVGWAYTNSSAQFISFRQNNAKVTFAIRRAALSAGTQTSFTSVDLTNFVPPNAAFVNLAFYRAGGASISQGTLSSDGTNAFAYNFVAISSYNEFLVSLPLLIAKTCYYMNVTVGSTTLYVNGYELNL